MADIKKTANRVRGKLKVGGKIEQSGISVMLVHFPSKLFRIEDLRQNLFLNQILGLLRLTSPRHKKS